ncbi:hypothetical protein DE146DRAFT_7425 [Phaeosphaeria sp. MPI-PUGE-AT-0046c]|nr:hypothetical protein DE146DRAFT_7425 [Phaeosphaeria sp. MPI-PUGE-AT-0046c]
MFSKAITISALAACASAHVIMDYPTPFGRATLNSSPLAPADFPCKQRSGVYEITKMNQWDAGETQQVSFNGTAVHGGGSCQFSITTDPEPTEKSQWKVIQSYVGGCPTGEYPGNAPEQAKEPTLTRVPGSLPVTMPKDIPDGRYTFSWTWMNKVGNREFYMNCAPIQVGNGGSTASTASAAKALSALPDMFVANLPADKCTSAPSTNFVYPNPGKAVSQLKQDDLSEKLEGSGCATQNKVGMGSGQIGSPSAGTPSTPSEGAPAKPSGGNSAPVASPINKGPSDSKPPLNPGGVFAPGASSAPAAGPTAQPAQPAQPAPPANKPSTPAPAPAPVPAPQVPNNTTPSNGECTPCTNDGGVVCIGSKQFGLCNRGCAVAQDLAAGMSCSNGAVVASVKRHINFPRAHIHRRLSAARLI